MTKREEREHLFRILFCKDFHDIEELKEQIDLYQEQLEDVTVEEFLILYSISFNALSKYLILNSFSLFNIQSSFAFSKITSKSLYEQVRSCIF